MYSLKGLAEHELAEQGIEKSHMPVSIYDDTHPESEPVSGSRTERTPTMADCFQLADEVLVLRCSGLCTT